MFRAQQKLHHNTVKANLPPKKKKTPQHSQSKSSTKKTKTKTKNKNNSSTKPLSPFLTWLSA